MIRELKEHKGSYRITLPKELVEHLGWHGGDKITFELGKDGKSIILRRLNDVYSFRSAFELYQEQEGTSDQKPKIYTIGYEGRTINSFIDILQKHEISVVVDVRELPRSRRNGFSKTALKNNLNKVGIEYINLTELGAPKDIRHHLRDKNISFEEFKKLYRGHLSNHRNAIKKLEELARSKTTVIMCYEKDWRICHRSIIAEILEKDGFEVIHL